MIGMTWSEGSRPSTKCSTTPTATPDATAAAVKPKVLAVSPATTLGW